ncbi:hypothetical protein A2863_01305 [Candidatus Woesebacteria bacterium RIFCSPHIGHO2_01_FULL_38_9b]|uniref:Uncharacterized protein n=1 Tax=Candidatus Woesebacteria bacterium RIFCSPHIGHO2_01_FULL_38_9b TaxID=1802493 RepID=A0A1F7Y1F5_9BACT|nr:MAG: hypothetical protein A2863_01305 [Candidatus Woesebacteria bacterium RIFCSPHIGHO2_01_FULL_38_9b]
MTNERNFYHGVAKELEEFTAVESKRNRQAVVLPAETRKAIAERFSVEPESDYPIGVVKYIIFIDPFGNWRNENEEYLHISPDWQILEKLLPIDR